MISVNFVHLDCQMRTTIYFSEAEGEKIVDMLGARLPMQEIKPDALEKLIRLIKL